MGYFCGQGSQEVGRSIINVRNSDLGFSEMVSFPPLHVWQKLKPFATIKAMYGIATKLQTWAQKVALVLLLVPIPAYTRALARS